MTARVLVTGAGGYLGGCAAAHLAAAGLDVAGTVYRRRAPLPAGVRGIACDLADGAAVDSLMRSERPDVVVHAAAAVGSNGSPAFAARALRDNLAATAIVASAAVEHGCARVVYCSTISVYGRRPARDPAFAESDPAQPRGAYGQSKYLGEQALDIVAANSRATAVSLRLAGIHGPPRRTGAVAAMVTAAAAGRPVVVREPESRYRFLFIDDAVIAVRLAVTAELPAGHHRFNIASGEAATLAQLAQRIVAMTKTGSRVESSDGAHARQEAMCIDRARAALGFAPRSLEDRLPPLIDWLRGSATSAE
ncbi:MAG: NAD(P)-dependent oxidoreductase [Rhodospirillales bacterium]|nr:NAD(P)-dependent oxidoreductase [Rhodospirillales bacterium]